MDAYRHAPVLDDVPELPKLLWEGPLRYQDPLVKVRVVRTYRGGGGTAGADIINKVEVTDGRDNLGVVRWLEVDKTTFQNTLLNVIEALARNFK